MTLRSRLIVLVVGLLTLVLGALTLVVSRALEVWTLEVVDGELARRAQVLADSVQFEHGRVEREGDHDGPLEASRGWPFRVEALDGEVLLEEGPSWAAGGAVGSETREAGVLGRLRVMTIEFSPHGEHRGGVLRLRVAAPLAAYTGFSDRVRAGLLVAALLAVVLGVLGAIVVARWLLRPLERLTAEARGLDGSSAAMLSTSGLGPDLSALAEAFNGVLSRLGQALEAQRAFTARASHALRTPLAAILARAEVALRRERTLGEYREALEDLAGSARASSTLVEGLLAVSRADAPRPVVRSEIALPELLQELKRLFDARAAEKELRLEITAQPGLSLVASKERLRELLDALVDNAIRYTPRGGTVCIEARGNEAVELEVRDSGPGIPPEERPHVFERFWRGSAGLASTSPGNGLGLSVVAAIAKSEGAIVEVGEAPEGGALMRVRFRRSVATQDGPAPET